MAKCDVAKGTHSGDLEKWTLIRGDKRKTVRICAKHAKALDTLWESLTPPQKPRKPLQVLGSLEDVPRV